MITFNITLIELDGKVLVIGSSNRSRPITQLEIDAALKVRDAVAPVLRQLNPDHIEITKDLKPDKV